jgi:hypothetical protein
MPVIVVRSGTRWLVPPDCQSATIEAVGAGSNSLIPEGCCPSFFGSGSYAKSTGVSLIPGSYAYINIPAGGSGGQTWFNTSPGVPTSPTTGVAAAGGNFSESHTNVYTAGAGNFFAGALNGDDRYSAYERGGYAGSAGPNGAGAAGGQGSIGAPNQGRGGAGGGGAANGGGVGQPGTQSIGGQGGTSRSGNAGGRGFPQPAGAGSNGSGGGGAVKSDFQLGGNGSLEIIPEWRDFAGTDYGVGSGGGGGGGGSGQAGGPGAGGLGTLGQGIIVITYTPSTPIPGTFVQAITLSGPVYIPLGTTKITVEAIGPGSAGGTGSSVAIPAGGGGAYAKSSTLTGFTPGGAAYARVPPGSAFGSTDNTWFNYTANSQPSNASQGVMAQGANGNIGGSTLGSVYSVAVYSGGNGGLSQATNRYKGGGGGAAAGPLGSGSGGGAGLLNTVDGGGGGGGGTSGSPATGGAAGTSTSGGNGGTSSGSVAGGTGGTTISAAGAGSNGSGGGGGGPSNNNTFGRGAAGSTLPTWTIGGIVYGPGSGGGGAGAGTGSSNPGGNGGIYGGGGGCGGGYSVPFTNGTSGTGGQGLVIVTYTVGPTVIVLTSGTQWFVPPDCQTATIEAVGAGDNNGGSYAKSTDVALTPGSVVDISIGAGATGTGTWLNTVNQIRYTPRTFSWSGTQLVAVDPTSNVVVSTDGITWTQKPGIKTIFPTSFVYTLTLGSVIVAIGEDNITGTIKIVRSTDGGASWSLVFTISNPDETFSGSPYLVGSTFVLITQNPDTEIYRQYTASSDGVGWGVSQAFDFSPAIPSTSPFIMTPGQALNTGTLNAVSAAGVNALVGGVWINRGGDNYGFERVLAYSSSPGGSQTYLRFDTLNMGSINNVQAVAYGLILGVATWVVVGLNGRISTTNDITSVSTWSRRTSGISRDLTDIVFDGTKFIALLKPNGDLFLQVITSADGINWSSVVTTPIPAYGYTGSSIQSGTLRVAGAETYLNSSSAGIAKTTDNGSTWTYLVTGTGSPVVSTTGVGAAGGGVTPSRQYATSVYTAGAGNFFYGGLAGPNDTGYCSGDYFGGRGGAAGPNGNGGDGFPASGDGGGAGGAANNSNVNAAGTSVRGGTSRLGNLGGLTSVTAGVRGGNGVNGSGGGGGYGTGLGTGTNGGAGSLDIISAWTDFAGTTYGVGSGAGGGSSQDNDYGQAGGPGAGGKGTLGQGIIVITYTPVPPAPGKYTQAITSSGPVYIPIGTTKITVEAIGPGVGSSTGSEAGGGGGAYAKSGTSKEFVPGGVAYARVPAGSTFVSTNDTWFNYTANAQPNNASQGVLARSAIGNIGGNSSTSIGSLATYSGGNGGLSQLTTRQKGGGGGAAAGPRGAGFSGNVGAQTTGTGGGGGGGGTSGSPATGGAAGVAAAGGNGGTSSGSVAGGTGGTTSVAAGAGSNGSGGGGGGNSINVTLGRGGNGSTLPTWTIGGIVYGPGSGGGGGGSGSSDNNNIGGSGGTYGGGGGAGGGNAAGTRTGGAGGQGLVVVTYTVDDPTLTTIVLTSGTRWFVPPDCQTATIEAIGAGRADILNNHGGSYAKSTGVTLTPGSYVNIGIPAGTFGGPAWLNKANEVRYSPSQTVWSGNLFVAVDPTNNVITSTDAAAWTQKPGILPILTNLGGATPYITAYNNIIVATAYDSVGAAIRTAYSSNGGTNWAAGNTLNGIIITGLDTLNGTFVLVTSQGSVYRQYTSSNGSTWSLAQTFTVGGGSQSTFVLSPGFNRSIFANSSYVSVGQSIRSGTFNYTIGSAASPGGALSSAVTSITIYGSDYPINGVAYGNGLWVIIISVGDGSNDGIIYTATNPAGPWTRRTSGTTNFLSSIVFDGTKFIIAVSNQVLTSAASIANPDAAWTTYNTPFLNASTTNRLVVSGATTYICSTTEGIAQTTNNGTTWTKILSGIGAPVTSTNGVAAAGGAIAPASQSAGSVYTAGAGNFYQGGTGGSGFVDFCGPFDTYGSGGGGAGPNGKGGNGGGYLFSSPFDMGGGGGAANGGGNGQTGSAAAGGNGGTGRLGDAGGAGGNSTTINAAAGYNGSGGGGGYNVAPATAGSGSLDPVWTDFASDIYGVGSGGGGIADRGTSPAASITGPAGGPGGGGSGTLGQGIIVITYTPSPIVGTFTYTEAVTSSRPVYVPVGTTAIEVETIGPGSAGSSGGLATTANVGGGGGAFARSISTTEFITGGPAYARVPPGSAFGSTDNTWFSYREGSQPAAVAQGILAQGALLGAGGANVSSIGSIITYSGGTGGITQGTTRQKGGGGGAAASRNGAGFAGGAGRSSTLTGGGGGGAGAGISPATAGVIGGTGVTSSGGAGGTSQFGNAGGVGGTTSAAAGNGINGSGGGGGAGSNTSAFGRGGDGSTLPTWTIDGVVYGPGSGGGGGGATTTTTLNNFGGNGGAYGGGGGAVGGVVAGTFGRGGQGGQGLVVITYTVVGSLITTTYLGNFFAFF